MERRGEVSSAGEEREAVEDELGNEVKGLRER